MNGGLRGVRAADMKDIKYLFTSCRDCTERGKGLSAIQASKSGPALAANALVSKRFVVYTWRPSWVFHFTSRRLIRWSAKRQETERRDAGTKNAGRTSTTPGTARTAGWSTSLRMLPTSNALTGSKQSRRLLPPATASC